MSVQVFLRGKLLGIEEFLASPAHSGEAEGAGLCGENLLAGRSLWATLVSEVTPRALLAELGLPKILIGSSGGGQFLLVLPGESLENAEQFLERVASQVREMSGDHLDLVWAATEDLGDWPVVRRRLREAMESKLAAPVAGLGASFFEPFEPPEVPDTGSYFTRTFGQGCRTASAVGWSGDNPARILLDEGARQWPIGVSQDGIPLARHAAPSDDGTGIASPPELARRAEGRSGWGVLRGDVDGFGNRARRLTSIEEYVQLSVAYKQFFAGELEVLCSMPEFWRKVTVIHTGGDDFAAYGSWDALILLAREIQRLFHRFHEESLKEMPGTEGKTISMAISFAPEPETPLIDVFREAGRKLELTKAADRDRLHLFGRSVEWRHLAHAADLKDSLGRMVRKFAYPPEFLEDMMRFYQETPAVEPEASDARFSRPWRYHRRLQLWSGGARDRELQKLRSRLIADLIGKNAAQAQLRPAGSIALEWAKLLEEA